MKVVALQHAPSEPMGLLEDILKERRIEYEYVKLYETNELPEVEATHIVIMGGPMGAYDEKEYPFLREEKVLIKESFRKGIPVLGICLGSQLIANALGAKVFPYKQEIGWYKVRKANSDKTTEELPPKISWYFSGITTLSTCPWVLNFFMKGML